MINEKGDVVWVCGNADYPQGTYVNSAGALGVGTDSVSGITGLPDKYMPVSCRSGFGGP
jgi:NAD(P)H-hydrate repair Nnr-like enzyme with NAD(P)H-hydrate dehydratase domain